MAAYASLAELKAYLGNFVSNDPNEPEFSDSVLQKLLDSQAKTIKRIWGIQYGLGTLPNPTGTKATPNWLDLILELLNLDLVVSGILATQSIKKFNLSVKQSKIYEAFGNWRFTLFETGVLDSAILYYLDGQTIDTTSFIDSDDTQLTSQTPNLTLTDNTIPSLDQVERFCLRESAFIRAIARIQGFELTKINLTTDQLEAYQDLLVGLVAPQICRINLSYYPQSQITDYVDKSLLDGNPNAIYSAKNMIEKLRQGRNYYSIFLD